MTAGNNWQPADPDVARLLDRMRATEARIDALAAQAQERREQRSARAWHFVSLFVSGLLLPLAVIGIVALLT